MSLNNHHPLLDRTNIDDANLEHVEGEQSHADGETAVLEFLIARLKRIAADQVRSRQYRRRSHIAGPGFRRCQRRGPTS
jgi:hypothetical protein